MASTTHSTKVTLTPADNQRLANLCGPHNEHLQQLEDYFDVKINQRSNNFNITGSTIAVKSSSEVLLQLYKATAAEEYLTPAKIHHYLKRKSPQSKTSLKNTMKTITIHTKYSNIKTHSDNQARYVASMRENDMNFAIGPAGTGKTYLAVACAVEALEQHQVERLILVRPAVEAGEKLGFLPGDIEAKVLPYLRPLYDALYSMLGIEKVTKLMEHNVIEIAPLAFMRGRTLNDAFIILDEAQNTTIEQMKMFLTRIGFGSTAVITGDITQIDLPRGRKSGLIDALEVLEDIEHVGFCNLEAKDAIRHPLVQTIIQAYAKYRSKHKGKS